MKNIVAIFIIIIALSGLVAYGKNTSNLLRPEPEGILQPGKYTCPYSMYNSNTKKITRACIIEVHPNSFMTKNGYPS